MVIIAIPYAMDIAIRNLVVTTSLIDIVIRNLVVTPPCISTTPPQAP